MYACTLCKQKQLSTAEGTAVPERYLLFSLEPCFDEIGFFLKAFYNPNLSAYKSRVSQWRNEEAFN